MAVVLMNYYHLINAFVLWKSYVLRYSKDSMIVNEWSWTRIDKTECDETDDD